MEKSKTKLLFPIIGGILLIAAGVLLLLDTLGVFQFAWSMLIGPLIGLGGLVFLAVFILFKKEWWAVIPGFVLIAIGLTIFMDQRVQDFSGRWGGFGFDWLGDGFGHGTRRDLFDPWRFRGGRLGLDGRDPDRLLRLPRLDEYGCRWFRWPEIGTAAHFIEHDGQNDETRQNQAHRSDPRQTPTNS